jgi:hypothetical protein
MVVLSVEQILSVKNSQEWRATSNLGLPGTGRLYHYLIRLSYFDPIFASRSQLRIVSVMTLAALIQWGATMHRQQCGRSRFLAATRSAVGSVAQWTLFFAVSFSLTAGVLILAHV